jgi:hypothetical protein
MSRSCHEEGGHVSVTYCVRWNRVTRTPIEPLEESEAGRRHDAGELYTAVVWTGDHVENYVEVRLETGYVSVKFLDEQRRLLLTYSFSVVEAGRMFLVETRIVDPDDYANNEVYLFGLDGSMERKLASLDYTEAADDKLTASTLAEMFEPVPSFGRYESVLRRERDRSVDDQPA